MQYKMLVKPLTPPVSMPVTRYLKADVTGTSTEVSKVLVEGVDTIGTTQRCLVGTTS